MLKKIKKIQLFRHIVQLISFILIPGLYIMSFSEIKKIYQMIVDGNFHFLQAFPSFVELIIVILVTMLLGRFFCGWFCAFGTYNDWLHLLSKNVFKINFKINEKVDSILKYTKYIVLLLFIIVSWTIGSNLLNGTSPWDAFAQITDFSYVIFNLTIGFILLVLITIGAFFIERFFCRYLCPLGAIFTIVSKLSIFKINKPGEKCGKCRMCTMNCSMGLPLYKMESVRGGECINCLKCLEVCPRKNTKGNIVNQDVNPVLASSVAIATFAGVYGLTNITSSVLTEKGIASAIVESSNSATSSQNYKDGTYTGTGTGFKGGTTKVSVTVSGGKITSIETISQEDTPDFYEKAEQTMFKKIVSSQSTDVDTISGATYSSKGIIEATEKALNQASEGSSTNSNEETTSNDSKNENTTNSNTQQSYKDGTYTGTGTGFKGGTTKISVTVQGGKITKVETLSNEDTPKFYESVKDTMSKEIISAQSTDVDTISGATYSCKGIIEAAKNALSQASENSSSNNSTTSNSSNAKTATNTQQSYKDGTYSGSGTGFKGGTTKLSVTVQGGKITKVETLSHEDTPKFYDRIDDNMFSKIISAQSTSVDTISGATYSCKGIIEATKNALSQAK
ncbi:FMN-binding protein [Clostridium sp. SHJSY1]|uniref:FMN-binding protein n=1 Tax=Clostridium sp. SHJSY1 TaxID=2942483 RepID=UPI0028753EF4|nr:FMN-binding protein [Clostridium sp. SHJSY1]MDS0526465.1 FMN-binding protein [Clostridium sp. SHJSY1]